jgi:hypothetical protein
MKAKVVEWEKNVEQEGDCGSSEPQNLRLSMTDGGGGAYFVIETERWAFSDIDELVEMLLAAGVAQTAPYEKPAAAPEISGAAR